MVYKKVCVHVLIMFDIAYGLSVVYKGECFDIELCFGKYFLLIFTLGLVLYFFGLSVMWCYLVDPTII